MELNIPNTINALESHFADLKNKLRNHNGLSIERKKKFIDGFIKVDKPFQVVPLIPEQVVPLIPELLCHKTKM